MNEELDSQLSAMFDGELPAVECDLLSRRLSGGVKRHELFLRIEDGFRVKTGISGFEVFQELW